jgi:hypothetical protein
MFEFVQGATLKNQTKAWMSEQNPVRVIKRAERERHEQQDDGSVSTASASARGEARELAATVKEWVSEFRQDSLVRQREINRRLGWLENEGGERRRSKQSGPRED